ncbi:MAG TPA: type IV pilus twitching motility protein PilT [Gammaproteobacteria bacterium]|nr:type IV pilus twitching motility protein PilT [Gammaproteobacteria bacterium]
MNGNEPVTGKERSGMVDRLLRMMVERRGSDLHLIANNPPRFRLHGDLQILEPQPLDGEQLTANLQSIATPLAAATFDREEQADFAYEIAGVSRFRVNVFRHLGGMGAVMRSIPSEAVTIDDLKLPAVVRNLCRHRQGMILVTGKTGSGKSTTLASMIHEINRSRKGHIITIEDPIEFLHKRESCLISQREVGNHTPSFAEALLSALREDPDVVLVGELRDLETMSTAITAAEMGILVMGTLHTNGAAATVDRIVHSFPPDKQSHVRTMLSTSLRGVISQQLCRRKTGDGRIAALEILVNTSAVANLLRQGKLDQLETAMQSGAGVGMRTMDSALQELLDRRFITAREAYERATSKERFRKLAEESEPPGSRPGG